jgi:hypothetical protein
VGCSESVWSVVERQDVGTIAVTVCYLDLVWHVRERYFYYAAGDGSAAGGTGSVGPAGRDTPMMTRHSAAGQAG